MMRARSRVPAAADQTTIPNYNAARGIFWSQLYPSGDFTLYCAQPFFRNLGLEVEHVYPAGWMVAHLGCTSRGQCRQLADHGRQLQATARDIAIIAEAAMIVANLGVNRRRNQRKRQH